MEKVDSSPLEKNVPPRTREPVPKTWHFMKPAPRRCDACHDGFVVSTKRFGDTMFVDRCSNCGKVYAEYKIEPR